MYDKNETHTIPVNSYFGNEEEWVMRDHHQKHFARIYFLSGVVKNAIGILPRGVLTPRNAKRVNELRTQIKVVTALWSCDDTILIESLILAQDERWRRA